MAERRLTYREQFLLPDRCGQVKLQEGVVTEFSTEGADQDRLRVGLCVSCRHVELVTSARRSAFYLCRLSDTDSRFPKYPALPVRSCAGYDKQRSDG